MTPTLPQVTAPPELRRAPGEYVVALAGNPNVGKSTVFNALTGLRQHTGNWPGKTVEVAVGRCRHNGAGFTIVDLPGTYSLTAHSAEEEIARDFICFGGPDLTILVADATCLERNLILVLQALEITDRALLCVNLMDEAARRQISLHLSLLSDILGIPVVGVSAREEEGLDTLMDKAAEVVNSPPQARRALIAYGEELEQAAEILIPALEPYLGARAKWAALRILSGEAGQVKPLAALGPEESARLNTEIERAVSMLRRSGLSQEAASDRIASATVSAAERIARETVIFGKADHTERDRKLDRLFTSRLTGIPIMLLLLAGILWLTIAGANYPSALLSEGLFRLGGVLRSLLVSINTAPWLVSLVIDGVYTTVSWVVSVMLPPMAIFFPLFTLLEDAGYLPRIAFNLDNFFRKACAHGKQSLTMCLGLGCNAAGVVGCRIIDSPRERLVSVITNAFIPCNGRFPTLIALITMFFAGLSGGLSGSAVSALMLTGVIVFSVCMTVLVSRILTKTILKGLPSSFHLELPPYRRPQIGRVIVRSVLDRTLFVLRRAVAVAAPAGLVIWVMANVRVGGASLLSHAASFLDPLGRLMGLDGFILTAFILGFPANEIVIPILLMGYLSAGTLLEPASLIDLRTLLVANGWTRLTALCMMIFSLLHWPCGTTCLTIRKETGGLKWTLVSVLVPTACGMIVCILIANLARLFGLA
ncbi:MAG: ferrous iron transport protein B [Clostridiales bacterium]|nr:ferrous iron transport protein B [Clostridiales bacterium]